MIIRKDFHSLFYSDYIMMFSDNEKHDESTFSDIWVD